MTMSVVTLQPPGAIYREEQWFGWWIYAGLGLIFALAWVVLFDRTVGWAVPWIAWHGRAFKVLVAAGVVVPPSLIIGVLRMLTLVTPGDLRISFGLLGTVRRAVMLEAITSVEGVQYHPIRD